MFRLRTTTTLSLLALAAGVAGTGWLSEQTSVWPGPPARYVVQIDTPTATRARPAQRPAHGRTRVVQVRRALPPRVVGDEAQAAIAAPAPAPELVPLATPADSSQSWDELRGHLDGRVRLHVDVDASGWVRAASLAESSGDPVLDQHALRSVRGWRFAVPLDHPDGLSGELPMRFTSQGNRVAQLP
ncbi:energy transducer TonB [Rhodanobacter thiooxydans]|uniref:Energy transducer TonB n=1 Tax=Rhodanobacter thiooxydans TaxID=416169 RepID=A0A154QMT7_9GAMM|nr:energy transducer TonB [Rhodanobacter thiooxydans]EIL96986.1 TonB family protein [Rhodanobacter thiooxydans LCS2]KZC25106.1 energy transducer TonB [Rhodanobacter thiooxydans]MCW0203248.1 energy transducer TonB [Rhodanobacter thiooxydans]